MFGVVPAWFSPGLSAIASLQGGGRSVAVVESPSKLESRCLSHVAVVNRTDLWQLNDSRQTLGSPDIGA